MHTCLRRISNVRSSLIFHRPLSDRNVKKLLNDSATFSDSQEKQEWSTFPYPDGTDFNRSQAHKSERPVNDPRETTIILFPGQGTQHVGMAKDLLKFPVVKDLFELANYTLGFDLLKICLNGPKTTLDQTKYTQLAVFVTSLAALERLKEERPRAIEDCVATAGFSLGEITALVFAGAIQFEKALKLIQIRAEAMQMACDEYPGGMATVIYGPDSKLGLACLKAKEWCLDKGIENPQCTVASYLYPHCKTIAGNLEALDFIEKNLKAFKLRRMKRMAVSGAFHSELMQPALEPFRKALNSLKIDDPIVNVHSNVDGKKYKNAEHIRRQLPKQIIKPVRWEQTMHILYERKPDDYFPRTFECGPGDSLRTILKQVNAKAWDVCYSIKA